MEDSSDLKPEEKHRRKRALGDQECTVCGDLSTGKHYGTYACDGCSGFFKRTTRRAEPWVCKWQNACAVDKSSRNECKACRLKKCLDAGMTIDGIIKRAGRLRFNSSFDIVMPASPVSSVHPPTQSPQEFPVSVTMTEVSLTALNTPLASSTVVIKSEDSDQECSEGHVSPGFNDTRSERTAAHPNSSPYTVVLNSHPTVTTPLNSHSVAALDASHCDASRSLNASHGTMNIGNASHGTLGTGNASHGTLGTGNVSHGTLANGSASHGTLGNGKRNRRLSSPHRVSTNNRHSTPPPIVINDDPQPSLHGGICSLAELVKAVEPVHFISSENIQDAATRLLSVSVRFARNVPCFTRLPFRDQIILLEEGWKELFLLDAAYWALPVEIASLLSIATRSHDAPGRQKASDLRAMQELLTRLRSFGVDLSELACLKAIVLFKPETKGLKDADQVDKVQDHIQMLLAQHVRTKHPTHPPRFGKLLLSLSPLHSVAEKPIEDVLFRKTDDRDISETVLSQLMGSS